MNEEETNSITSNARELGNVANLGELHDLIRKIDLRIPLESLHFFAAFLRCMVPKIPPPEEMDYTFFRQQELYRQILWEFINTCTGLHRSFNHPETLDNLVCLSWFEKKIPDWMLRPEPETYPEVEVTVGNDPELPAWILENTVTVDLPGNAGQA